MEAELSAAVCKSMIDDAIYESLAEIADYNTATDPALAGGTT